MPGAFALCTLSAVNRPVVRDTFALRKPTSKPTIISRIMPEDGGRVQTKYAQEMPFLSVF